jgi:type I restriction enzyme S subunit
LRTTDFGDVPANWPVSVLSSCAHVQTGIAKGRNLDGSEIVDLPYLRVANVQDGRLDLTEMKTIQLRRVEVGRFLLEPGDVVLTEGGDFDKLGRGFIWRGQVSTCVHQNHIFAVRADGSRVLPEFLAYLAQSSYGKAYFLSVAHKTTNLACINTTKLKALPVLLPPLPEQREIVVWLSAVDAKLAAEESRRAALAALFQSLLHHLMTGKVRLPEFGKAPQ